MGAGGAVAAQIGGDAIDVAGGLLSTWLANRGASINAGQAQNFSAQMANTAHQREVADLKAAGLNPVLSGMGGSGNPSPQGVMWSPQKYDVHPARDFMALRNAAIQAQQGVASADQSRASAALSREQIVTQQTQQTANSASAARDLSVKDLNDLSQKKVAAEVLNSAASARAIELENVRRQADMRLYKGSGELLPWIDKIGDIIHGFSPMFPSK